MLASRQALADLTPTVFAVSREQGLEVLSRSASGEERTVVALPVGLRHGDAHRLPVVAVEGAALHHRRVDPLDPDAPDVLVTEEAPAPDQLVTMMTRLAHICSPAATGSETGNGR